MSANQKAKEAREAREALEQRINPPNQAPGEEPNAEDPPATPAPETPPATEPKMVSEEVAASWQSKYETLFGKYNAEVPRLNSRVRELETENTDLKRQIESLKAATPASVPAAEFEDDGVTPVYVSPLVTDEMRKDPNYAWMVKEYGKTFAERHYESMARSEARTKESVKTDMKPVADAVVGIQTTAEEEKFSAALHVRFPEWTGRDSGIDVDPGFTAWVQTPVPGAGNYTYGQLLSEAYWNFDLERTAGILEFYKSTIKPAQPAPVVPEHLAAPARSGGGSQTVIDNQKGNVLFFKDYDALIRTRGPKPRGNFSGTQAEYDAKKREFEQASAEGRLV